jgi:serine/threonine-protein kinase
VERHFLTATEEWWDAVIATTPAEGQDAARDSKVTVTVSSGPAPRPVPDLANKPYEEAAAALTQLGFTPVRADAFHDTVPVGAVIGTTPGPGAALKPGNKVTVTVSKGPDLVAVPTVNGHTPAEAQAILQANGLSVSATYGPPSGKVFSTVPAEGTKVKRGSAVALYTR